MNTAHATLSNFRQSPRKMRVVANLVRGKRVADALVNLQFTDKRASLPIRTLIASALANAKSLELPTENLVVKSIRVDAGKTLYRRQPAAHGRAHPIRKRTSQILVELGEDPKPKKVRIKKEKTS
jgi:large subunit ribosomal protein L22